jgi:hypothetical protein
MPGAQGISPELIDLWVGHGAAQRARVTRQRPYAGHQFPELPRAQWPAADWDDAVVRDLTVVWSSAPASLLRLRPGDGAPPNARCPGHRPE